MPFTDIQIKALSNKLSVKHVRTRQSGGKTLSYIEGWHTIAEANRIFGYDAWDRQTMTIKCVWEGMKGNRSACSYIARVRIRVRAGDVEICREGCGSGHGTGLTPGEAHENAIKEAETDAMKRALTTFGNPFGLALYDKEQQNVRGRKQRQSQNGQHQAMTWLVLSSEGECMSAHEDPVDYCKAVRQLLEAISTRERLRAFWQRNSVIIAMFRRNVPDLKTDKGEHYADILTGFYKKQMRLICEEAKAYQQRTAELEAQESPAAKDGAVEAPASGSKDGKQIPNRPESGTQRPETSANAGNGHVDKTNLPISTPRRIRDKEHLRYVAAQPCIICGRSPAQAHHLRFAQPSALGRKVSDKWTVPLCATHHRSLHSVGDEERWWREKGIDASAHAVRLWWGNHHSTPDWARGDGTAISSS
jgi:DNA recombination protein Rad52